MLTFDDSPRLRRETGCVQRRLTQLESAVRVAGFVGQECAARINPGREIARPCQPTRATKQPPGSVEPSGVKGCYCTLVQVLGRIH